MRRRRGNKTLDPKGVGHHAVPSIVRTCFWTLSSILISYGLYGAISGTLVLPAGKSRAGESFAATYLHGWAALVALVALMCFCLAIRAVILDEYLRFPAAGQRRRVSTVLLLILSFAVLIAAMVLQIQSGVV